MKRLFGMIVLVAVILAGGCRGTSAAPTGTATSLPATATSIPATRKPSPIPTATLTPMPGAAEVLDSLPSGEYLLDMSYDGPDLTRVNYEIYSPDGIEMGVFSRPWEARLSPDLKYFETLPNLTDLRTGEVLNFTTVSICGPGTWSPDGRQIVADCSGEVTGDDLVLLSLDDLSAKALGCSKPGNCEDPVWSPDGKWIAYKYVIHRSGLPAPIEGLHLMDTRCFTSGSGCAPTGTGLDIYSPYSWSPNGTYLALSMTDFIGIYTIQGGRLALERKYWLTSPIGLIAWSPSGKWIWADAPGGPYLVSVATGEATPINVPGSTWILVP